MFIPALKSCDFSERMLTDEPFKLILTIKMVYGLLFSRIIGISKIWIIMPCFAYAQRSSDRLAHVPSAHSLIRLLQQAVVLLCSVKITNRMVILTEQSVFSVYITVASTCFKHFKTGIRQVFFNFFFFFLILLRVLLLL